VICVKLELSIKVVRFSIGWLMLVVCLVKTHLDFCTSRSHTQSLCCFTCVTYMSPLHW